MTGSNQDWHSIFIAQCLRRLYEEKDAMHGLNGLKYFSTILAVSTRTAYTLNNGNVWKLVAWITSANATIFSTYWDIVIDWGLFQRNSKNILLRDKLLVPHKSVYFAAMVSLKDGSLNHQVIIKSILCFDVSTLFCRFSMSC